MKRYWKLMLFPAVILGTFGVYYLLPFFLQESLFELQVETEADPEGISESITIMGNVYAGHPEDGEEAYYSGGDYDPFELDSDGMTYLNRLGYFERLDRLHPVPEIDRLKRDYRSFMRGVDSIELIFEDEIHLAYAGPFGQNPEDGKIQADISLMEKETGEAIHFRLDLPLQGPMHFINVSDVQMMDGKLYILTTQYGQSHRETFMLYQIDIKNQALEETYHINESIDGNIWIANDYASISKETHYVFSRFDEEANEASYLSYSIKTGEVNEIEIPDAWTVYSDEHSEEINPVTLGNYAIKDNAMYFISFTEDKLVSEHYNLEDGAPANTSELEFGADFIEGLELVYTVKDKAALISTVTEQGIKSRIINVVDLSQPEVIYEGTLEITNTEKDLQMYDIDFYQVYLD